MSATVVRFDAELLVHRAAYAMGCNGAVVTTYAADSRNPRVGTLRRVTRCSRLTGHDGEHGDDNIRDGFRPVVTACGVPIDAANWIDWTPAADDPLCPICHGAASDEQEALL